MGKNSKKYYKNIISTNMMRFSGRQTVRNMCVISFLIAGALFATFYVPSTMTSAFTEINTRPIDYTFFYNSTENQIKTDEIYELANKHGVKITEFYETNSISLITDGNYIDYDESGKIIETYFEKLGMENFYSESEFNRITKQNIDVKIGEYFTIISGNDHDSYWSKKDDLSLITHPTTNKSENISFGGDVTYTPLEIHGMSNFVLSDEDFERLSQYIGLNNSYNYTLFNVKDADKTYAFAKELRNEIILRSSEESAVISSYDNFAKSLAMKNGEEYWADSYKVDLSVDNNQLFNDWKYYPQFNVLNSQDLVKNFAVFLMLFIYIAIICFAAVAIISYTRSITIGLDNKTMFMDLKKLGAKKHKKTTS